MPSIIPPLTVLILIRNDIFTCNLADETMLDFAPGGQVSSCHVVPFAARQLHIEAINLSEIVWTPLGIQGQGRSCRSTLIICLVAVNAAVRQAPCRRICG